MNYSWQLSWRSFFWYFTKKYRILLVFYFSLAGWVGLHGLLNSYLMKVAIDSVGNGATNIWIPAFLIMGNYELHNLSWRGINMMNYKYTPLIKGEIVNYLFNTTHENPLSTIHEQLSGTFTHHISHVGNAFERLASNSSVRLVRGIVQFIASLLMMGWVHPTFAIIFFVWALLFSGFSIVFSRKIDTLSRAVAKDQAEVAGKISDSLTNTKEVRLFAQKSGESQIVQTSLHLWKESYQKRGKFFFLFYLIQGFSITCLMGAMQWMLLYLYARGGVTMGDFAFILGSTFFLTDMVWANTELVDQLNDEMGQSNQGLRAIFHNAAVKKAFSQPSLHVKNGTIIFDKIHFSYHANQFLFHDFSLKVQAGEKVGITGRSGAGKSTLIHLLLGFYQPARGTIAIDGQNIHEIESHSLYQQLGVLSQDPSLFHRSFMDNIRFGNTEAADSEIIDAAKQAGLEIGQGLLGERGFKLSGGQRQRVALARVILKNAPILVLDEPTSQLDAITEEQIKNTLYTFMKGKTTIAIAHRLSTLLFMDRIIVLDQGNIVEEGSHRALMQKDGLYASLWETQMKETSLLH